MYSGEDLVLLQTDIDERYQVKTINGENVRFETEISRLSFIEGRFFTNGIANHIEMFNSKMREKIGENYRPLRPECIEHKTYICVIYDKNGDIIEFNETGVFQNVRLKFQVSGVMLWEDSYECHVEIIKLQVCKDHIEEICSSKKKRLTILEYQISLLVSEAENISQDILKIPKLVEDKIKDKCPICFMLPTTGVISQCCYTVFCMRCIACCDVCPMCRADLSITQAHLPDLIELPITEKMQTMIDELSGVLDRIDWSKNIILAGDIVHSIATERGNPCCPRFYVYGTKSDCQTALAHLLDIFLPSYEEFNLSNNAIQVPCTNIFISPHHYESLYNVLACFDFTHVQLFLTKCNSKAKIMGTRRAVKSLQTDISELVIPSHHLIEKSRLSVISYHGVMISSEYTPIDICEGRPKEITRSEVLDI